MIIEYSDNFLKESKQLSKKSKLLKSDLKQAFDRIESKNIFSFPDEFEFKISETIENVFDTSKYSKEVITTQNSDLRQYLLKNR